MYERDWRVPLMKELGVDYRLDATHCIEHTKEQLDSEIGRVGLVILEAQHRWGEIWAHAVPQESKTSTPI